MGVAVPDVRYRGAFAEYYVRTLALAAGLNVLHAAVDDDGVDAMIRYSGEVGVLASPGIDVQIKSWATPSGSASAWHADGLSVTMCRGLADLGGLGRRQPFEIGFRWARAVPSGLPTRSIRFEDGDGVVLHDAARELEQLIAGGQARITGMIESLHDEPRSNDRRRVRVRGELTTDAALAPGRPVWVRLDDAGYDRALDAHRRRLPVRAHGRLQLVQRRVELHPGGDGFETL